jgi:hypothetical protein
MACFYKGICARREISSVEINVANCSAQKIFAMQWQRDGIKFHGQKKVR